MGGRNKTCLCTDKNFDLEKRIKKCELENEKLLSYIEKLSTIMVETAEILYFEIKK